MAYTHPEALVSTEWLHDHLDDEDVRVLDASFKQPGITPTARDDYDAGHIPGAVFFDIDDVAQPDSGLPHMVPTSGRFSEKMRERGIGNRDRVVVYDTHGLSSAGRAWWLLRLFGHENVALLDGGLAKWKMERRPLETALPTIPDRRFTARADQDLIRSKAQILANVASQWEQVVDARSAGRFDGSAEETWPGRRRGHIPGSRNVPFDQVTDPITRQLKEAGELTKLFRDAGVNLTRPIIASCGSGVTACALAFALYLVGRERVAIYDGSWAEWGLPDGPPIETGPAKPAR
jgi:thiosulfate/3-mercaptopyruvate sulfurtransferase